MRYNSLNRYGRARHERQESEWKVQGFVVNCKNLINDCS